MARIFVSYRREDSPGHTGRLYDHLVAHFGEQLVFRDIEAIELGADFVKAIEEAIGASSVLIAVIGPQWLTAKDRQGRRRLDNPKDFVRLELATALSRGVRVIPVLVDGASMPPEEELPPDLSALARRNAIEVSDLRFRTDVARLLQAIDAALAERQAEPHLTRAPPVRRERAPHPRQKGRRWGAVLFVALLTAGVFGAVWWTVLRRTPGGVPAVEQPGIGGAGREEAPPPRAKPAPSRKKPAGGEKAKADTKPEAVDAGTVDEPPDAGQPPAEPAPPDAGQPPAKPTPPDAGQPAGGTSSGPGTGGSEPPPKPEEPAAPEGTGGAGGTEKEGDAKPHPPPDPGDEVTPSPPQPNPSSMAAPSREPALHGGFHARGGPAPGVCGVLE
ncbi:toll/interleukin-1 receptor domain-containing protein [Archangium violaceum]|uniref:toll/interleukin-1 receptor domain-containing protein n=1 Tax=Archangium violaceum TaxID=83451 RepID=UPI0019522628|nr:toll/interleukin-1 receptor domain-containing protein [Archangium violaceum]QRN94458.1 toll/interleukin-1 receptor domain-containing protein [Archangium violaceum]